MTEPAATQPDGTVPAGFTYLGQFVDHDLTMDRNVDKLGGPIDVEDLLQGRSPALDLDSVYGRGPADAEDRRFFAADGVRLRTGASQGIPLPDDPVVNQDHPGFDLPRSSAGDTPAARRAAVVPDQRNDENLVVAQLHSAFIRFHNRVVDRLAASGTAPDDLYAAAHGVVVRHYQWLLRTDFLPRIVDPAIVEDVFTHGRRYFDVPPAGRRSADTPATMPIEFSVAAYRLGHSMVRGAYQWNRLFNSDGPNKIATLLQLFTFTGDSGNFTPNSTVEQLDDVNAAGLERLPSNWIVDFRRLFDFTEAGRSDLAPPDGQLNHAKRIDSLLVDPLALLPAGTFGGRGTTIAPAQRNLAFRNLTRADMVQLATGQQMAAFLGVPALTREAILTGAQGAVLDAMPEEQRERLARATPLWFYVLRETELNRGQLGEVGGRIVAETFHRALENSRTSISREPHWRPTLGPDENTFRMTDLLLFAFEGSPDLLNPLGDAVVATAV
ncbi:heme peroxidase family protein [Kribbella sp. NPDC051770]|uniref:peroxidase family protein n=1 Tax=Kribbella sp. NPDC051770 TaxID=3155413 RepID=UPI00341A032B